VPGQVEAFRAILAHRHAVAKRRADAKSAATATKEIEYLYTDYEGDYSIGTFKHRIVKKTAKRVYVARYSVNSCNEDDKFEEDGQIFHDVKTIALDRQKLETEGYVSNSRHWSVFFTTPWEERNKPATSLCLEVLGLEAGADGEAIKSAYLRLVRECHPDHGGDPQQFKRLQTAYETAMSGVA
jgi:hypothetical protein